MVLAVIWSDLRFLYTGIVLFTIYQQCISSTLSAVLTDNVERSRRTDASFHNKISSSLGMALAPATQIVAMLLGLGLNNEWTQQAFLYMLLPAWAMVPFIGIAIIAIKPVGLTISTRPNVDDAQAAAVHPPRTGNMPDVGGAAQSPRREGAANQLWLDEPVLGTLRRRFMVLIAVNSFFIFTLLANGMTSRYFNLYYTNIMKFNPIELCVLNVACRLWIAVFNNQLGTRLARLLGRSNIVIFLHVGSAVCTLGIYGGGLFEPGIAMSVASYLMRSAFLQTRDAILTSMTMDCAPESRRARCLALNSLRTLSFSASAVVGGILADAYGYQFSFTVTVWSLLAGTFLFIPSWFWFPRKEGAT